MTLMFQAEVARKVRAEVGDRERGSLSVWVQNRWDVERLLKVPRGSFSPPPRVESEVLTLHARARPRVDDSPPWQELLRAAFAHPRRMLRSLLADDDRWRNALERSGVDGTKRPQTVEWGDWVRLREAAR